MIFSTNPAQQNGNNFPIIIVLKHYCFHDLLLHINFYCAVTNNGACTLLSASNIQIPY